MNSVGASEHESKRVVVVGASSGIGRSIAMGLAARGARVGFLARRRARLEKAAAEAGNGAVAISCDVTDERSCRVAIAQAAEALGGIDGVVYSSGVIAFTPLVDTDAATWGRLFATNVIGAALITAAALPHLMEANGTAVYLSSVSASLTPPWPMIGSYVTTKAALDKLVDAWRAEHPDVGFTRLTVGDCAGGHGDSATEFAAGADPAVFGSAVRDWMARGYMSGNLIDVADLVDAIDAVLACSRSCVLPSLTVTPRGRARSLPGALPRGEVSK